MSLRGIKPPIQISDAPQTVTLYEYAALSEYVYHANTIPRPQFWEPIMSYQAPSHCIFSAVEQSANFLVSQDGNLEAILPECSYFAEAYLKADQIVIAHRGSESPFVNPNNWWENLANVAEGELTRYYSYAVTFTKSVMQYAQANNYTVNSYTGHSLGAHISDLLSATFGVRSVNFDNPGSVYVITHNAGNFPVSLSQLKTLITTYNSAPNLVNTMDNHPGTVHRVYPSFGDCDFLYTLQQHTMLTILSQFTLGSNFTRVDGNAYAIWNDGGPVVGVGLGVFHRNSVLNKLFYEKYDVNPYYWEYCKFDPQTIASDARLDKIGGWFFDGLAIVKLGGINRNFAKPGVVITGDNSGNQIWGTTNYADTVNSGTGNDHVWLFSGNDVVNDAGGYDVYHFYQHNMLGKQVINDADGQGAIYLENVFCNLRGNFKISSDPSQYIFKPKDQGNACNVKMLSSWFRGYNHKSDIFLLRLVNNEQDLQITYNSQNVKAFPYSTDTTIYVANFTQGNLGISLPNQGDINLYSTNETDIIGTNGDDTLLCLQNDNSELYGLMGNDTYVFYVGNPYNCSLMGSIFDTKIYKAAIQDVNAINPGVVEIVGYKYGDLLDLSAFNLTDFSQIGYDVDNETSYFTFNNQLIIVDYASRDLEMTLGNGTFRPVDSGRVVVPSDSDIILSIAGDNLCDGFPCEEPAPSPSTCHDYPLSPGAWAGIGIASIIGFELLVGCLYICIKAGGGGGDYAAM